MVYELYRCRSIGPVAVRFTSTSMDEIDRELQGSLVTLSRDEFVESLNRQWVKTIKHEYGPTIARKIACKTGHNVPSDLSRCRG